MGIFDPATFMDQAVNESNATVMVPCPAGEYNATAQEPVIREWKSKDGTKSGVALDIFWDIDDAAVRLELGRDKVLVKQSLMLDLNASGGVDTAKGANVGLGRLREALSLNIAGEPFTPRQITGRVARIRVEHRMDGDTTYADVKGVTKIV